SPAASPQTPSKPSAKAATSPEPPPTAAPENPGVVAHMHECVARNCKPSNTRGLRDPQTRLADPWRSARTALALGGAAATDLQAWALMIVRRRCWTAWSSVPRFDVHSTCVFGDAGDEPAVRVWGGVGAPPGESDAVGVAFAILNEAVGGGAGFG